MDLLNNCTIFFYKNSYKKNKCSNKIITYAAGNLIEPPISDPTPKGEHLEAILIYQLKKNKNKN